LHGAAVFAAVTPTVLNIKFYANADHSRHRPLVIATIIITMLSDGSVVYSLNPLELKAISESTKQSSIDLNGVEISVYRAINPDDASISLVRREQLVIVGGTPAGDRRGMFRSERRHRKLPARGAKGV